jgi:GH15 family glucan-1,4-alpha-glucosidase
MLALTGSYRAPVEVPPREDVERRVAGTVEAWRRWLDQHEYDGPWSDAVHRSVLTLKLLVDARSGAVTAAPTTSLPERIGGPKNWDYRYAWVRDTSFTLDALMRLGFREQAHDSFTWLLDAVARTHPRVQPIYRLNGDVLTGEEDLDLAGYRGSTPVRCGNAAAGQLQLGGFGALLETTWLYAREGNVLDEANRRSLAETVDLLCDLWPHDDAGIWEIDDAGYTQSKMACWEAFDRALRLVDAGQLPADHAGRWRREADRVREHVERACWSDAKRAYVQAAGGEALDASCLLAARLEFHDPASERILGTIEAVRRELGRGPLLYRYTGMEREEGAFLACSFWLVEALARAGRLDEAAATMEELIALANDVGLYSEEIDPETGEFLGNFPQGLSHLALVNAAAIFPQSLGR